MNKSLIPYLRHIFTSILLLSFPTSASGNNLPASGLYLGRAAFSSNYNQYSTHEFPENLQWFNTEKALKLSELKGKIVLLNFWTYSCINCQHIMPDINRLENKYPDELIIIGVHSGKFDHEKDSENIRQAVIRYGITHPVVNDAEMQIWYLYDVRVWPTSILLDPAGRIVGSHSGEGIFNTFDQIINQIINNFNYKGMINNQPLEYLHKTETTNDSILSFPTGILADESTVRLFISDTGHNRIILARLDGKILEICGSGQSGFMDGSYQEAKFNRPQGLALSGNDLYVADTGNHSVRVINLSNKTVTTLAGVGRQGHSLSLGGPARFASLNSPWDLEIIGNSLYVTMAGSHQIYRVYLRNNYISLFAGTGIEDRTDGPRLAATLAQPSGLTTDGRRLFFTDSETSSVRWLDTRGNSAVTTLIGHGLFQFGDKDGHGDEVFLQHPTGLIYYEGLLYLADTYNNKIKVIEPLTKTAKTLIGGGNTDSDNKDFLLNEPSDISVAFDKLFITDTNNHLIRIADIKTARMATLPLIENENETNGEEAAIDN